MLLLLYELLKATCHFLLKCMRLGHVCLRKWTCLYGN